MIKKNKLKSKIKETNRIEKKIKTFSEVTKKVTPENNRKLKDMV